MMNSIVSMLFVFPVLCTAQVGSFKAKPKNPIVITKSEISFAIPANENLFPFYYGELEQLRLKAELGPSRLDSKGTSNLVRERNQNTIKLFKKSIHPDKPYLSHLGVNDIPSKELKILGESILLSLLNSSVVSPNVVQKYDPYGDVGFCFGRATFVHLELIRRGVNPNRIGKVFLMGNFSHSGHHWDFHVATFVWDQTSILVIDDTVGRTMSLDDWFQSIEKFDFNPDAPTAMLYITDPAKFHPALGPYTEQILKLPQYNNYFIDMIKGFKNQGTVLKF